MKQLKTTTLNSYSTRKLVRHLDRAQDLFINNAPYRIDWSYNKLLKLDAEGAYWFESSLEDKSSIINAINNTWRLINKI